MYALKLSRFYNVNVNTRLKVDVNRKEHLIWSLRILLKDFGVKEKLRNFKLMKRIKMQILK
jgi:hypothetical protein